MSERDNIRTIHELRLLREVARLRGELVAIVHVCRNQGARAGGKPIDPVVSVIESIAVEALAAHRDRRLPEEQ